jgi:hypothetical protein
MKMKMQDSNIIEGFKDTIQNLIHQIECKN